MAKNVEIGKYSNLIPPVRVSTPQDPKAERNELKLIMLVLGFGISTLHKHHALLLDPKPKPT